MTGSLKAKPLHAVPAAPLGLMGDQWAVDSANSRAAQQIHPKAQETNTNLTRRHMKAWWSTRKRSVEFGEKKKKYIYQIQVREPANVITVHTVRVDLIFWIWIGSNPRESLYQIHLASASETSSWHLSELLSARFSLLCVCLAQGRHAEDSRQSSRTYDFWRANELTLDWKSPLHLFTWQ